MFRKLYHKLFPPKGLIISHDTYYGKKLVELFINCDIIDYKDFKIEKTRKYKYFILSGGSINISGDDDLIEEKEFIRSTKKPIFGICLGFQIICIAFGAELKEFTKENISPSSLSIRTGKRTILKGQIENRHHCYIDEKFRLPYKKKHKYLKPYTRTEYNNVDSATNEKVRNTICVINENIFAVQGHPEISGEFGKKIRDLFLSHYL